MQVLYIDDYKRDEEAVLRDYGVHCERKPYDDLATKGFKELSPQITYILRGQRLNAEKYNTLFSAAQAANIRLNVDHVSYTLGSDYIKQYEVLDRFYPRSIVINAKESYESILGTLLKEKIRFPLFLRSEIESAAKYVGVDGCMVKERDATNLGRAIINLRNHVSGYTTLIFKEAVEIQHEPDNNAQMEYRAIGMGGSLIMFDFDKAVSNIPHPETLGLESFVKDILETLACNGAKGGFFVDVAMSIPQRPVLIECKSLVNGNIKSLKQFAAAIR